MSPSSPPVRGSRQSRALVKAELYVQSLRLRCIERVHHALYHRLADLTSPASPGYAELLAWLTAQAVLSVADESHLRIQCRADDASHFSTHGDLIRSLLLSVLQRSGLDLSPWHLSLSPQPLPPPPQLQPIESENEGEGGAVPLLASHRLRSSLGGVVLLVRDGAIRADNSMDHRMDRALHDLLPFVRRLLWGDDLGHVRRLAQQRRGRVKGSIAMAKPRPWERHEAHLLPVGVGYRDTGTEAKEAEEWKGSDSEGDEKTAETLEPSGRNQTAVTLSAFSSRGVRQQGGS